jgi:peptidoglycan hydrolase-like protein with peptidoglycan-binding domain
MKPIREGDRGPAVEDIQRRLLLLGYALGPSGVDGVFAGHTLSATKQFQSDRELNADGLVGDTTWAALVDATFTLGDRALYLRLPHMHGRDVRLLQEALGALGFPCRADSIFGPRTEEAVRDFQRNVALPADGITGANTVEALQNLRHLWEGKGQHATVSASDRPARGAAVLERVAIAVRPDDAAAEELAARIANLALATTEDAQITLLGRGEQPYEDTAVLLRITGGGTSIALTGVPLVSLAGIEVAAFAPRMAAAFIVSEGRCREVVVDVSAVVEGNEQAQQRVAVTLLDALCSALDCSF